MTMVGVNKNSFFGFKCLCTCVDDKQYPADLLLLFRSFLIALVVALIGKICCLYYLGAREVSL